MKWRSLDGVELTVDEVEKFWWGRIDSRESGGVLDVVELTADEMEKFE